MGRRRWVLPLCGMVAAGTLAVAPASAQEPVEVQPVEVQPVEVQATEARERPPAILLAAEIGAGLSIDGLALDEALADAATDLGFDVRMSTEVLPREEHSLAAQSARLGSSLVVPTLNPIGDEVEIRLVIADPESKVLLTETTRVAVDDAEVRALVMLRDLAARGRPTRATPAAGEAAVAPKEASTAGRAILAVNGTLYGGFLGYSLQRASGSDDPRLLYPLIAVGSGVGLGSAIILADELDITSAQAWFLSAGAWWPAVAGHLLYEGRFADTGAADEGWAFGLVSSVTGVTLATVGLTAAREMRSGGAVFAHSGGALGTIVGGLTEFAVSGDSEEVPFAGMGYGAGIGWLLGNSAGVLLDVEASNLLAVDLGILLGGLAGAAAGSPLLFEDVTKTKTRGWVAATGGGLVLGGIMAWWLAWDDLEGDAAQALRPWLPSVAQVGIPPGLGERGAPGWGLAWSGSIE